MKLNYAALVHRDAGLLQSIFPSRPRHVAPSDFNRASVVKEARRVRLKAHARDLDCLVLESVLFNERLGGHNGAGCAITCGAAFAAGEVVRDFLIRHNLLPSHRVAKLRVRVLNRVLVVLGCDFRDMLPSGRRLVDI